MRWTDRASKRGALAFRRIVAAVVAAAIVAPAGGVFANEKALLIEAMKLVGQAEASSGAKQAEALASARERLQRIVDEHPDSTVARQLLGKGVPVMGGAPISLAAVDNRIRQACLARPTQACLFDAAFEAAKTARNDVYSLNEVALRQSEAGLIDDARKSFAVGRERALAKIEHGDDGYTLGTIARGQAEAWMFEDAVETATLLGEAGARAFVSEEITEKLCEAGRLDDAEGFAQSLPEDIQYMSELVLAREFARAGRLSEALAMAHSESLNEHRATFLASASVGVHARGLPIDDLIRAILDAALSSDDPINALTNAARIFRTAQMVDVARVLVVEGTALADDDKALGDWTRGWLGAQQAALGMNADAEATYKKISDPDEAVRLLRAMAEAHASNGSVNEVIAVCQSIGSRAPTSRLSRDSIGHSVAGCLSQGTVEQFLKRDEPDNAIVALNSIIRDYSQYKRSGYLHLIRFYAGKGDFSSAMRRLENAESLASVGLREIAIAEARAGKIEEALEVARTLTSPQDIALAFAAIAAALPR